MLGDAPRTGVLELASCWDSFAHSTPQGLKSLCGGALWALFPPNISRFLLLMAQTLVLPEQAVSCRFLYTAYVPHLVSEVLKYHFFHTLLVTSEQCTTELTLRFQGGWLSVEKHVGAKLMEWSRVRNGLHCLSWCCRSLGWPTVTHAHSQALSPHVRYTLASFLSWSSRGPKKPGDLSEATELTESQLCTVDWFYSKACIPAIVWYFCIMLYRKKRKLHPIKLILTSIYN